jgi:hypothetical protein
MTSAGLANAPPLNGAEKADSQYDIAVAGRVGVGVRVSVRVTAGVLVGLGVQVGNGVQVCHGVMVGCRVGGGRVGVSVGAGPHATVPKTETRTANANATLKAAKFLVSSIALPSLPNYRAQSHRRSDYALRYGSA